MTQKTLDGYLTRHSRSSPDRPFLHDLKRGRRLSYINAERRVEELCAGFQALGLKPGDLVMLYLGNSIEFCLLFLASLRFGTVVCPFPSMFIQAELERDMAVFRPRVLFAPPEAAEAVAGFPDIRLIPVRDEVIELGRESLPDRPAQPLITPEAPALLYHSPGPAPAPRGIMITHRNLSALIPSICRGFQFHGGDRHLILLPLAHSAAVNYSLLPALLTGGTVFLTEGFWNVKDDFWEICVTHGITYAEVVPSILFMLMHLPAGPRAPLALPYVGCGSAPLSSRLQRDFESRFGLRAANLYGLTETGPTHVDDPRVPGWRPGTIGRSLDVNRVVILDEDGRELPPGREGEIAVAGENVFPGYALHPEAARHVFRGEYFLTGDLGARDADGIFYFYGVRKPLIIRGGINIHPGEIDEVLRAFPGVETADTHGVPDDFFGERIICRVRLKGGAGAGKDELEAYCRERLSPLKRPEEFLILA